MTDRGAWKSFWQSIVRLQTKQFDPWIALRNTIGLTVPLAVGVATNQVAAGLAVATGALNVAFRDSAGPYKQRARLMLAASVVAGIAVFAGGVTGRYHTAAVVIAGVWAFGAGMLVALGAAIADLGVLSLVLLLIYATSVRASEHAVYAGLLACAGGLVQTALSLAFWPLRRYEPERRALGEMYLALAKSPPATAQSIAAHEAIGALDRDDSLEAIRYRLLLRYAERLRMDLVAWPEQTGQAKPVLEAIGNSLLSGEPLALDQPPATNHLRAAAEIASHATEVGAAAFERGEAAKHWRLRVAGSLATLRAHFTLDSGVLRHALRLAACVAIGDAAARASNLGRGYWLPMTIAIVLRPDYAATMSRGALRLLGTLLGLVLSTGLAHLLPAGFGWEVAAIAIFMFAVRYWGPANYGILVTGLTAVVVFLVAMSGVAPSEVITERAWSTLGGGLIALAANWLWPTWERTQFPEAMARMLDAYRIYFHHLRSGYESGSLASLARYRLAGRLTRTNMEASMERMRDEPGISTARAERLGAIKAESTQLAYAMLALEAALHARTPLPAGFPFFANEVEVALHSMAAALRGSPVTGAPLPEIRAAASTEAERIAESLNTLGEELWQWIDQERAR